MKNLKKIVFIIFCLIFVSCSVENNNLDTLNGNQVQLPNVIKILESKQYNSKGNFDFYFTAESDFVGGSGGCYTVNVRVYIHDISNGMKTLIVNENVKVGDCPKEKSNTKSLNSECESFSLKNGDSFISNGTQSPYCMSQLIKYDIIYNNYIESMSKFRDKN